MTDIQFRITLVTHDGSLPGLFVEKRPANQPEYCGYYIYIDGESPNPLPRLREKPNTPIPVEDRRPVRNLLNFFSCLLNQERDKVLFGEPLDAKGMWIDSDEFGRLTYQACKIPKLKDVFIEPKFFRACVVNRPHGKGFYTCRAESISSKPIGGFHEPFVRADLPKPMSYELVGREEDIRNVKQMLLGRRGLGPVVIQGIPGVGKTSLCVAIANLFADDGVAFPDGVLWYALGPEGTPEIACNSWANDLRIPTADYTSQVKQGLEPSDLVRKTIGNKYILVVADDVWERGAELLVGGHNCSHLLSTRESITALNMAQAEGVYKLEPLEHAHAVELFKRITGDVDPEVEAAINPLLESLDGLPLMITIVAHTLYCKKYYGDSSGQIIDAIKQFCADSDMFYSATVPEEGMSSQRIPYGQKKRKRSLEEVLAWSTRSLPDDHAREAFEYLSLFQPKPHKFTKEAALAVLPDGQESSFEALLHSGLVERAAKSGETTQYHIHQAISAYAKARFMTEHELVEEGMARMADYYRRKLDPFTDPYGGMSVPERKLLADESGHIRVCIDYISDRDDTKSASELVCGLCALMSAQGLWNEMLEIGESYINRVDPETAAHLGSHRLSWTAWQIGDFDKATHYAETGKKAALKGLEGPDQHLYLFSAAHNLHRVSILRYATEWEKHGDGSKRLGELRSVVIRLQADVDEAAKQYGNHKHKDRLTAMAEGDRGYTAMITGDFNKAEECFTHRLKAEKGDAQKTCRRFEVVMAKLGQLRTTRGKVKRERLLQQAKKELDTAYAWIGKSGDRRPDISAEYHFSMEEWWIQQGSLKAREENEKGMKFWKQSERVPFARLVRAAPLLDH